MKSDILIILMIAFGLFAILMFVLFYVYAKRNYNQKNISEDYEIDNDNDKDEVEDITNNTNNISNPIDNNELEFIPKKKKIL